MRWDLFCRVVDNLGDIGFAWRLAVDLASRGVEVRLWLDDRGALAWMAPAGAAGVSVRAWADAGKATPADVVVETFGCGVPAPFAARMAARAQPPVWIDVEYLSAEPYVERSHGLPSPRPDGPAKGLTLWFYYPGFTEATGGLLRELDLAERQRQFARAEWLRSVGLGDRVGLLADARVVSLFCYRNPALPHLLEQLAAEPTLLLATAGDAAGQVSAELGAQLERGALQAVLLPPLSQLDYDRLLWASDLNFVRGEDSFVRAQWAGVPLVWQVYPQPDRAHLAKLEAFVDRHVAGAPPGLAARIRSVFAAWNGLEEWPHQPQFDPWRAHCAAWRAGLWAQTDLATRLLGFAAARMLK